MSASEALAPVIAARRPGTFRAPWLLSAPAFLLFACLLLVPLALTAVLSFQVFDHATGVKNSLTFSHYAAVLTDSFGAAAKSFSSFTTNPVRAM